MLLKVIQCVGLIAVAICVFGTVQWIYEMVDGMAGFDSWGYYVGTAFQTVGLIVPH